MTKEDQKRLEREFNKKYSGYIKQIEEENFLRKKKMEIKQLKKENRKKIGLTTTKLISYYLFFIFNAVLVYAMVAMWHFADLTYLGVIISDIIGQILVYGIYAIRAFKDTQSEESIKLERDKLNCLPEITRDKLNDLMDRVESLIPPSEPPEEDVPDESIEDIPEASIMETDESLDSES